MQLRTYQNKDRAKLIQLWQTVFPDDPPHNDPAAMIAAKLAVDDLIFIAEQDDKIIAACVAGYDGHRGWLYAVATDPQHRRLGIGRKIVRHAMQQLKARGCIKVNIQIRSDNSDVAAFYQSLGFETEPRLSMGAFL